MNQVLQPAGGSFPSSSLRPGLRLGTLKTLIVAMDPSLCYMDCTSETFKPFLVAQELS